MVCIPCFVIPVLLYIWHKFIQPYVLRFWNPWEIKDAEGNVVKNGPEFPFNCKDGVCSFKPKSKEVNSSTTDQPVQSEVTPELTKKDS